MKKILISAAVAAMVLASCASVKLSSGQLYETRIHLSGYGWQSVILAADFDSLMQLFAEHDMGESDYERLLWRRTDWVSAHDVMSKHNAKYLAWYGYDNGEGLYLIRRSSKGFEHAAFNMETLNATDPDTAGAGNSAVAGEADAAGNEAEVVAE